MTARGYPPARIPQAWINDGAHVTITDTTGRPLIAGRLDVIYGRDGLTDLTLTLGTIDGRQIRALLTLPSHGAGIRVCQTLARGPGKEEAP